MNKDYYEILGLTEEDKKLPTDEFNKKLKSIYRKLSMEHHPDRYGDSPEDVRKQHEEKFKEISEAYSVLSDENKRREYDMGGRSFEMPDFESFMRDFNPFGDFFGEHRRQRVNVGSNLRVALGVTLEDVLNGATKTISFYRTVACHHCHKMACPHCHGTGQTATSQRNGFAMFTTYTTCRACGGTGIVSDTDCPHCHNSGAITEKVTETINIPAGVEDGMVLTIQGLGNEYVGLGDGINGALEITIRVQEHPKFQRNGMNLIADLPLTIEEAWCGCDKAINTLDGKDVRIRIPELTVDGKMFKVTGRGLPNAYGQIGDLFVRIKYIVPKEKLNDKQKKLLKDFYKAIK